MTQFLSVSMPKRAALIAAVVASLIGLSAVIRSYPYLSEIADACAHATSNGLTSSQFPFAVCTSESPLVGALRTGLVAASVYGLGVFAVLVLVGYGIRKARHRPTAANMSQVPLSARIRPEPTAAERRTEPPAVPVGTRRWFRPSPLLFAIGAALAWAVLSVGPINLVSDLGQLVPRDTVTAASCVDGQPVQEDGGCSSTRMQPYVAPAWCPGVGIHYECLPGPAKPEVVLTRPGCAEAGLGSSLSGLGIPSPMTPPEADGMCHERSGGMVEPLMNDVFVGSKSGLLAFLAVGASLLIWPRLRAANSRVDDGPQEVL